MTEKQAMAIAKRYVNVKDTNTLQKMLNRVYAYKDDSIYFAVLKEISNYPQVNALLAKDNNRHMFERLKLIRYPDNRTIFGIWFDKIRSKINRLFNVEGGLKG